MATMAQDTLDYMSCIDGMPAVTGFLPLMIHYLESVMCRLLLRLQFDSLKSAEQSNLTHVFSLVGNNTISFYTYAQLYNKSQH